MATLKRLASTASELTVDGTNLANQVKRSLSNVNLRRRVIALTTLILMLSMQRYSEHKNSTDTAASVPVRRVTLAESSWW